MSKQIYWLILIIFALSLLVAACAPQAVPVPQVGSVNDESEPATVSAGEVQAGEAEPAPAQEADPTEAAPVEPGPTAAPMEQSAPEKADIASSPTAESAPAVQCTAPAALTPSQTEGPYYTPNTPERTSLVEDGMPGTRLVLEGYVLSADCQPIAGAWIDFWQADASGVYDNQGYTLRGHQYSDERGAYRLETVVPGEYPGRTPHIHVKVQAPGGPVLTTQVYFPGASGNQVDRIFNPAMLVQVESQGEQRIEARFDFVIAP